MKGAEPHAVPLCAEALMVLERQAFVRTGESIFPGGSGSPLSYSAFATAPAKAGIDGACPHGWRSIFRRWAGDIGEVPRELAESALAHSLGSVESAYWRGSRAVERRREVMWRYSQWLTGESAQVLEFPTAKQVK
jgi:integrase